jgi:LAO/AO transport system kinase
VSRPVDVRALVDAARAGSARALGRLVSLVEDAHPALREVMAALAPDGGRAWVVGITGSPGVGKSTTTSALVTALRGKGLRVGVLAVDPSSPFSGGALLGDRIRMQEHATDPDVFIRSMATRGHLGGLSWAAPQALRVLDAGGFDVVFLETVGVGQSEVEVAALADTTLVLLAPGMGDGVQAAKAGILEIGDVLAVNKADRDGADAAVRDLEQMVRLGGDGRERGAWRPRVVRCVASRNEGIDDLLGALRAHIDWARAGDGFERRRLRRAAGEIEAITVTALRERIGDVRSGPGLDDLAADVVAGRSDPWAAAEVLLAGLTRG